MYINTRDSPPSDHYIDLPTHDPRVDCTYIDNVVRYNNKNIIKLLPIDLNQQLMRKDFTRGHEPF